MGKKSLTKKSNSRDSQLCHHDWASLLANTKKGAVPSPLWVCLKCGEFKVGSHDNYNK